jgi:O6-methylguanine-DNA--protein-cysteine methyltransferase
MKAFAGHKTETTSYQSDWSAAGSSLSHPPTTDNSARGAAGVGGQDEKKTSPEPPPKKEEIGPISQIIEKFFSQQSSKNSTLTNRQRGVLDLISKCPCGEVA